MAFLCGPDDSYVASMLGAWRVGGVAVPLCTAYPPAELSYFLEDAGVSVVMGSGAYKDIVQPLAVERNAVFIDVDDLLTNATHGTTREGSTPAAEVSEEGADAVGKEPALIIYTSGTTGRPKGVVHDHDSLEAQIRNLVEAWRWHTDDRILHVLPLHHVHGVVNKLFCALWAGATVDFVSPFDTRRVWKMLTQSEDDGLSLFMAVPTIYAKLIECYNDELSAEERRAAAAGAAQLRLMVSG